MFMKNIIGTHFILFWNDFKDKYNFGLIFIWQNLSELRVSMLFKIEFIWPV